MPINNSTSAHRRIATLCALATCLLVVCIRMSAQVANNSNVGLPPNGTFEGTGIENVQVNNGNLHIEIPLFSLPGRGMSVSVSYVYDSKGWWGYIPGDSPTWVKPAQAPTTQLWRVSAPLSAGGMIAKAVGKCGMNLSQTIIGYTYQEPNGTSHPFPPVGCSNVTGDFIFAEDGSGYAYQLSTGTVISKAGQRLFYQNFPNNTQLNRNVLEDANGNQITRGDSPQRQRYAGSITCH
jgi:hypothetical protein